MAEDQRERWRDPQPLDMRDWVPPPRMPGRFHRWLFSHKDYPLRWLWRWCPCGACQSMRRKAAA